MKKEDLIFPQVLRQTGDNSFRSPYPNELNKPLENHITSSLGLTKRELFAVMALQGIMSDPYMTNPVAAASLSVQCADALIFELKKEQEITE